jgi:hypothetical protein
MTQFRGIDPINEDNWLVTKVKQNPEAFLVLAAGCALLLRSAGSTRSAQYLNGTWSDDSRRNAMRDRTSAARHVVTDLQDRVNETAAAVSEKASQYASSVSDSANAMSGRVSEYASSLSDQASEFGNRISDHTMRMSARAQSSMQEGLGRMVKEQPFALAALGVAVGATVAAFLPPTEAERDALRPLGDAAAGAVTAAKERVGEAVSATGEHLQNAAEQRGLSSEGIKDMAREATETFTDKLTGSSAREPQADAPPSGGSFS